MRSGVGLRINGHEPPSQQSVLEDGMIFSVDPNLSAKPLRD